jgi:hypothetical protein
MNEELIPLLGEIRDQLKRIADVLQSFHEDPLPVDVGEPVIRLKEKPKEPKWRIQ